MEVVLPAEYPRQPAACRMLTPVFHPNIDVFTVCTSDFHAAQETLADLIARVGQMITFQKHNVKSPLNAEAAIWCEANLARLPVDRADLYPGEGVSRPLAPSPSPSPSAPVIVVQPPSAPPPPVPPAPPAIATWAAVGAAPLPPPPPSLKPPAPPPPPAAASRPSAGDSIASATRIFARPSTSGASSEDRVDEVELDVEAVNTPGLWRVRARAGEIVHCRSGLCMLALRAEPMRAEIRSMSGTAVRGIAPRESSSIALDDHVVGVHDTYELSVGVLDGNPFSAASDQPAVRRFWNSVCATELTLVERLISGLHPGRSQAFDREALVGVARAKLAYLGRVLEAGHPSPAWRESLEHARLAIEASLKQHGGGT
jgi:hypothetical protein